MQTILQDLRYGARVLMKKPGFTFIAVLTLALGIGANTAIFSVVNALLFRSLPYKNPERLVMIWETNHELPIPDPDRFPVSVAAFDDWRKQAESFEAVSIFDSQRFAFTGAGAPERVAGITTSAGFFDALGVSPILGRTYTEEEDRPGANKVAVLSYALWQKRFGGDMEICGKTMQLDGDSYTIIGVMPQGMQFPRAADLNAFFQLPPQTELWTPMQLTAEQLTNRGSHSRAVIARLKPGVSFAKAQAELDAIASRNQQQYPNAKGWGAHLMPMQEQLVGGMRPALLILLGAVGLVLLIACANVANLLLARAAARQKEMAVRMAMGASRWRLVRQLLTESLLLALIGGGLGVLLAVWGVDLLLAISPASIPRKNEITVDVAALGFTFAVALMTGVLFGLAPAFQVSRVNLNDVLKEGARGSTGGRTPLRSLLVVAEVALSLVLLTGAGLLVRSFARLTGTDPGFDPHNVAAMNLSISSSHYEWDPKQRRFFKQVLERMRTIPGALSVGAVSELPLSGSEETDSFNIEGRPAPKTSSDDPLADFRFIDEGYFKTLAIPLITGRAFTEYDNDTAPPVVVINESLARRYFNGEDPVGKRVKFGSAEDSDPWATIVGVVRDIKHSGLDAEARPQLYFPYQQMLWGHLVIVVRSATDAQNLFDAMREAVWAVDKDQPITSLRTMESYLSDSVSQQRFNAVLLAGFALLALVLASVGIYGVMSYSVTQRTHELGIRMALGAKHGDVFRLVVIEGMRLALSGVALGLVGAFAATRLMSSLLFAVSATDPLTFAAISLILTGVALGACLVPARRATRVDPMVALRYE
ncbi:MAG TPA: ABC transporter permease [Blastocatellia bacterium]|nr:ABC transporter permease [Blastocatellia bacterium]